MNLTNGDIFNAAAPLKELSSVKFPVGVSFRLAQLINKVSEPYKSIDSTRVGLVNKYGSLDEQGRMRVNEDSPEYERFLSELNELLEMETELVFQKVKLPAEGAEIEPSVLMALVKFVEV